MVARTSALERIQQLKSDNSQLTGEQIARQLLQEDYSLEEAQNAFLRLGYVSAPEQFSLDTNSLHVSNYPMEAGLGALIASSEPRALPRVIWRKKV